MEVAPGNKYKTVVTARTCSWQEADGGSKDSEGGVGLAHMARDW